MSDYVKHRAPRGTTSLFKLATATSSSRSLLAMAAVTPKPSKTSTATSARSTTSVRTRKTGILVSRRTWMASGVPTSTTASKGKRKMQQVTDAASTPGAQRTTSLDAHRRMGIRRYAKGLIVVEKARMQRNTPQTPTETHVLCRMMSHLTSRQTIHRVAMPTMLLTRQEFAIALKATALLLQYPPEGRRSSHTKTKKETINHSR